MIYQRSKSSDVQFAPFTDAQGTTRANSFNLFEWTYDSHPDPSVRRGAWHSFSAGLKAYNHTWAGHAGHRGEQERGAGAPAQLPEHRGLPAADAQGDAGVLQQHPADHPGRGGAAHAALRPAAPARAGPGASCCTATSRRRSMPTTSRRSTTTTRCALILDSLACMGPEYVQFVRNGLEQRWVDRADNIGKSSGAFCATPYGVHPYILITWADTMRNVFVLTHELGHGAHFGLAMKHQRFVEHAPGDALRGGAVDHARDAAGAAHPGPQRRRAHAPLGDHAGARHLPPQLRHPPARGRAAAPRVRPGRGRAGRDGAAAEPVQGRHPGRLLGRRGRNRRRRAHDLDAPAALLHGPVPVHLLGRPGGRRPRWPAGWPRKATPRCSAGCRC